MTTIYEESVWENIPSEYSVHFDPIDGSMKVEMFMTANIPASAFDIDINDREKATDIALGIIKQHYPNIYTTVRALIEGEQA